MMVLIAMTNVNFLVLALNFVAETGFVVQVKSQLDKRNVENQFQFITFENKNKNTMNCFRNKLCVSFLA